MTTPSPGDHPPGAPPPRGGWPPPPGDRGFGQPPPGYGYGHPPPGYGYGQPPPGYGYGQPPAYGYGQPPGYSPYGQQPPAGPRYSVSEAFDWARRAFSANARTLVPAALVNALVATVLGVLVNVLFTSVTASLTRSLARSLNELDPDGGVALPDDEPSSLFDLHLSPGASLLLGAGALVLVVVAVALRSALVGGLLDIADGRQVGLAALLVPRRFGPVLAAGLLAGVAAYVGALFCILPGLVVGVFAAFAPHVVIDRGAGPVAGIKASVAIVKPRFWQVSLALLLSGLIAIVGVLVCWVGLLVALPVAELLLVYTYRTLAGGRVAPIDS